MMYHAYHSIKSDAFSQAEERAMSAIGGNSGETFQNVDAWLSLQAVSLTHRQSQNLPSRKEAFQV